MKIYVLPILALLFFACQSEPSGFDASPDKVKESTPSESFQAEDEPQIPRTAERPPAPLSVEQKINVTPRRVIKNADYRIQVDDVDASTAKVISLTEANHGYVANMNLVNTNYETSNQMTLKVPSERFENFLNSIGEEAVHTAHRQVTSQDVTAEFVDLQARLKTRKEVKARYEDILRKQTKTVAEVLDAEEKIRRLQEEIEAAEGRLRMLANQTGMSTVKLDLYQPKEYEHEPLAYSESFWLKLWEGFESGWAGVTSVILFFVNLWPIVFAAIFVWWRRKKIFGRFYKKA